ncbi:putative TetR family transcriptional regulator [Gordonia hirsuta DSM 44140 = NBRC 16056]|uniref:Putative TetR family transcriptional regulator n=1 Tax=Gordonia hirsuta DSM 44140 = NBRC 16056 TaxID=1121927 RepID=L7LCL0_9ACTN|nr:TetR family transcriptional regulator [Gordonia hirsuta]GAC57817.1 putative TetR family transcriptional regulator [Gordonia hirsuta DSM 44140 = NBRC 16056]
MPPSNRAPTEPPLRDYGGEAGDARVARRRAALIEATLDLLAEPEAGAVTVRGICSRAGLTPRYFYESFAGVDELVAATYDEVIGELAQAGLTAFAAGTDSRDKVARAVRALVDVVDSDRRKGSLMFADTMRSPVVAAKRNESTQLFVGLTTASAIQAIGAPPGPVTTAAAYFQVGGLGRLLATWVEGGIDLDREALISVCIGMLLPDGLTDAFAVDR